ncbi:Ig-like domain-containing protein [Methylobacter svalbardensis]|uniref:Ig-like domain-containing protein n=1 Tax=Methylobacter svalbardensis TaxID=3080016 RepID=UPI0030EDFBDE
MNTIFIKTLKADPKRSGVRAILSSISLMLLIWLSAATLTQSAQAATVHWLTLVSLTFDDGRNQSAARDLLARHGMQGTFYINSDKINSGGTFLTKPELDALYADGNEIAGHNIGHANMATLSDTEQQAAICNDMQNLVDWGYSVHSFAYPFSSTGPTTQSIVAGGCPGVGTYESARAVGGLVSGTQCSGCPWAETVPPANPYYISTNNSVISTTTLADMQNYVIQAETNGGGWVPLVFHNICDGCGTLAVSPATLDAFLTWLEARTSQSTYVRTVHQVMSGDYPAPPPPPQLDPNELINPSLEIDADGNNQADCWQRTGYGSNSATWTRTNDAHSGNFGEQLKITSYTSGDRKLLPTLDAGQSAGGCAPTVAVGEIYQLSAWYKATVSAAVVLYYRDANGVWQYWMDGPQLPASVSWAQMTHYVSSAPAGTQAISFGISLNKIGTLTTDDYSVAQVLDSAPTTDTTPPIISGFAPADGATVSGTVSLNVSATDDVGLQKVEFLINGTVITTDTTSPYAASWDSTSVANGTVAYSVSAVDYSGNVADSTVNQLVVNNDLAPPTVAFNQPPTPTEGAAVSGQVTLAATATDNVGVTRVDFLVNGSVVGSSTVAPYSINWNSLLNPDGPATIAATAFDAAGNGTSTPIVNVTVNNNQAGNLLTNPSLEVDANNDGIADCWQRAGFGTNAYSWTRISGDAHSGNFSESLQVTSRTSGDRKLVQRQDSSTCAPAVTVGARYTVSGWYKSTIAAGLVVYYRTSTGVWQYWQTSANFAAATNWAQASYTTPPVPAGATAISFGLYLNNVGTLITDDYSVAQVLDSPPPTDTTPPIVSNFAPADGTTVSGTVSLTATATDNVGVTRVDFLVNGSVVGSSTVAPYSINWNSLLNPDGPATIAATAFDAAGNGTSTPIVNVTVNNNQAGNLLTNPSLEVDANNDGIADCWQRAGFGTNAYSWTRISGDAHSGNFSESLQVTSRTSGDRKLVQRQDSSTCAPAVTVGARYTVSGWYKSTIAAGLVVYYRTSTGVWQYWQTSANFAAATNWAQASYTTPPVPAGATAISFGLYLNNVGTLITDDYSVAQVLDSPPPTDTTPPIVSNFAPADGTTVSGTVSLTATATDNVGVTRVDFLVNGSVVGSSTVAPYSINWNSLLNPDGPATIAATAFDAAGNGTSTPIVNVTVNNNQAGNLLTNPSLEVDANNDGIADCWQRAGFGTNAYSWTRISGDAHSGNFSESLQVTSRTSGDRKLVQRQDSSTCAPAVTVGARYTVSGWYKSTIAAGLVVYYRTSTGVWQYWQTSANFAAATNWAQASYTTPPVPAGATAISFGLYLNNVGTLITDDYAMTLAP